MAEDFDHWFVRCAEYCIVNYICPDDYVWNLYDCAEWKRKYELGMSFMDASLSMFTRN